MRLTVQRAGYGHLAMYPSSPVAAHVSSSRDEHVKMRTIMLSSSAK